MISKLRKIHLQHFLFICLVLFTFVNNARAQDVMDGFESDVNSGRYQTQFTETIRLISRSKKVFILTNTNQNLFKGDFITLLLDQKNPVVRALVGKVHDGLVGIKILKIYSLSNWKRLGKSVDVQIVKGDDTFLFTKKEDKKEEDPSESVGIESEEDLYNTDDIDKELNSFNKDNRLIKPDNIIGGSYSQLQYVDQTRKDQTISKGSIGISWAYQIADNIWIQGVFRNTSMKDTPEKGTTSTVNALTARIKYTFKLPFYSYAMPYAGFLYQQATQPTSNALTSEDQENEDALYASLNKKVPVFGVTLLKRLVPGWFLQADLGIDVQSLGVAIEF